MQKNKKVIAILYTKQEVYGCDDPTYIFIPSKSVIGEYNKKEDLLIANGKEYHSVENDDACLSKEKYYFNNFKVVDKKLSDESLKKLANSHFKTDSGLVYIKSVGDHPKKGTFNVNEFVDNIVDIEEEEKNMKNEIEDAIETLKGDKLTTQAKLYLIQLYTQLTSFMEGSVYNGIIADDLSDDMADYLISALDELDSLLEEKGIDVNAADEYGYVPLDDDTKEDIKPNKVNTYDPNKRIYPEYSIDDLYKGITDVVIDQDEQVMEIATYLYKRMTALELPPELRDEFGLLITGNTGVGKSEIFRTFARIVNLPILFMDAKQIVPSGYKGTSIEEKLIELYKKYNGDMSKISRAITILDEVDKIAEKGNNSEVAGGAVQDIFLKFMDGTDYKLDLTQFSSKIVNTTDMTPISMGSFIEMYNRKQRRLGFGEETPEEEKKKIIGNFTDYGMKKEFMGRQKLIVHLNDLSLSSMIKILNNSKKSSLKAQQALFNAWGVDVVFTDDYKEELAKSAMLKGTGARALSGEVERTTKGPVYEISKNKGKYHQVIFTDKTVQDPKKYILK